MTRFVELCLTSAVAALTLSACSNGNLANPKPQTVAFQGSKNLAAAAPAPAAATPVACSIVVVDNTGASASGKTAAGQGAAIQSSQAQDFTGYYNIKLGDTVLNGDGANYASVLDAADVLFQLIASHQCQADLSCTIVPAGKSVALQGSQAQDFTGQYNIKIGDTVINGKHSAYSSTAGASKDIAELQADGVCK